MRDSRNKSIYLGLACLCAGAFALLLILVLTEHTAAFDDPVRQFFYALRSDGLTGVLSVLTNLANKYLIIGLCLLLLILPQTRLRYGVTLSAGALATTILNHIIKIIVCRERPDILLHLVDEGGYSFPSGHSISSMFFYGMAIWLVWHYAGRADGADVLKSEGPDRKKTVLILTVLLLIPMILVGLTRIYLGVHFPTDVLAGWSLGLLSILIEANIILALERRRNQNSLTPDQNSLTPDQNSTAPGSRSK